MDRAPALETAILAHLRACGRPETSRNLAARFLRVAHGDEETCRRLLAPFLAGVPGIVHLPGDGWTVAPRSGRAGALPAAAPPRAAAPEPAGPPAETPSTVPAPAARLDDFVALASDGGGPRGSGALRAVSILPVIAGEACQEEHFPAWASSADEGAAIVPDGEPGDADAAHRSPSLPPGDLAALLEAIGDLPIVCHRVGREVDPLRRACASLGLPFHAPVISAAKLGHLLLGLKANHALLDLAAVLSLESRGPDDCRGRIGMVASAYLRLLPILAQRGIVTLDALLEYQDMPAPPLDLSPYEFTADDLKSLPPAPGVYQFLDAAGRVLYVGKAANLRSRVGSYFTPSACGTEKGRSILERVRAFSVQTVGSELEAVLLEAALIQELRPPLNRQFDVHERPAPYGPRLNLVIVLPDTDASGEQSGTCTLHSLKGGRYLGRVPAIRPASDGPAGDAWSRALGRVARDFIAAEPGTAEQPSPGTDEPRHGLDLDWQLVASFLRRHGDAVNVLDVDECGTEREARDRLLILARAAVGGGGKTVAR